MPTEAVEQPVPFQRTGRRVTVSAPPQNPIVKPNRIPSTHGRKADMVDEDTVVRYNPSAPQAQEKRAGQALANRVILASAQKTTVKPPHIASTDSGVGEVIAEDTVIRNNKRSGTSRALAQKRP
jgi:hypothetical protein